MEADSFSMEDAPNSAGAGRALAFEGQTDTHRIQVIQRSVSVSDGVSFGIAPTGHNLEHWPHWVHSFPALGWKDKPLYSRYGWLPGTVTLLRQLPCATSCPTFSPNAAASLRSASLGRFAAIERTMECSAIKAPAAATQKPFCSSDSVNSNSASS